MATSSNELARLAGPKSKEIVAATVKRWEEKMRERLRLEMALKLTDDSGWRREVQRVKVTLSDGLPRALVTYERDLKENFEEIAGLFRPQLQALMESSSELQELLGELSQRDGKWSARRGAEQAGIEAFRKLVQDLLNLAEQAKLTEELKKINEDVLGAYFPLGKNSQNIFVGTPVPFIEIYWTVIGAVARTIGVDIEGLTIVVLAHELAHAYSHLGADTDGNRWEEHAFCRSDVSIKEGIAQYYTEKVMHWFEERHSEKPYHAYTKLLEIQGAPYRIHELWSKDFSPEIVRAAIIECRNNRVADKDGFTERMESAKRRLKRQRRPSSA